MKKHFFQLFLILAILAFLPVSSMAGSATLNWQPNPENDLGGYRVYYGISSRSYGPPLNVNTATTCTLNTLSDGATYYFAVTAYDTSGNESGFSDEVHKSLNAPDTSAPTVALGSPTSGGSYATGTSVLTVSGTATDNVGVTQVAWSNDRGGSGTASGTTSWKASSIQLSAGTNTLTFTARDAAGNHSSKTLMVTYNAPDTSAPTVAFSSPTSGGSYATGTSALTVSGTAADNVGVTQVAWSNDRGGSGTASGTASWKASSIQLSAGTNTLTFTARDAAGNHSSKTLVVTYNAPDTSAPTVSLSTPTSGGSYATESAAMMVTGTATDNVGVTQVAWSNDRGGSGTASGTGSWTAASIALHEGVNNLTFTAEDKAGNQGSKTLAVTYTVPVQASSDQVAPAVRIVSPTSRSNYFSRIRSVDLAGTAFDNTQVAKITWKNSRGETGTASGKENWAVAGIPLDRWINTVTITAHDAAGNTNTASLRVFCWR